MLLLFKALDCIRKHNCEQLLIFLKLNSAMLTSVRTEGTFLVAQGVGFYLSAVLRLQISEQKESLVCSELQIILLLRFNKLISTS